MTPIDATVVIPSRNRQLHLQRCLTALSAQRIPHGAFEVVVVDDESEPPLDLNPKRWAGSFSLTVVRQRRTGPAGARQRGVAEARGRVIAFTDDDCLPAPSWLSALTASLTEHPDALIGGSTFNGLEDDLWAQASQLTLELVYAFFNRAPGQPTFFASNNIACQRHRYLESGGFDTRFPYAAAEDREFCDRWKMQGRPLLWDPRAVVEHQHAQSLREFVRLHFRYGQGAAVYHSIRHARHSGSIANDIGFHFGLPSAAWTLVSRYGPRVRLALLMRLALGQAANAAGFAHAHASRWLSRQRTPVAPIS